MIRAGIFAVAVTLLIPASAAAQAPIDIASLVLRDGAYVDPDSGRPYSGPVVGTWDGTLVREKGTLRNGRWDGVREWYHGNSQLATRESYRDGRLDGLSEAYFKGGEISVREMYRNGELDGPYTSYWVRGRLAEQGAWASGRPCGEWMSFGRLITYPACPA